MDTEMPDQNRINSQIPISDNHNVTKHRSYYIPSGIIFILAIIYCYLVYSYSSYEGADFGYYFLLGIPNYFIFYLVVLPFVTAGILFLGTVNSNIRFWGILNPSLKETDKKRILRSRKILFYIALTLSVMVTIGDTTNKGRTLPPYSLSFSSDQDYVSALIKYDALKKIGKNIEFNENDNIEERLSKKQELQNEFFSHVKTLGFEGESITGFPSFSSWLYNSSIVYKVETFLSWLGALIISLFFSQFFLSIMVKDSLLTETKNILLWLLILCSFWIPTKTFSVYYHSFTVYQPSSIIVFAVLLLLLGVFLVIYIKVDKNDMMKYAELAGAAISIAATLLSIFKPEYLESAFVILKSLGIIFGGILLFVLAISIYLVTDNLLHSYERQKIETKESSDKTNRPTNSSTNIID